ncbi:MAG: F0F1 ATP synthase subunit epsilon [Gammaproteobacteria bacterium]|nr:MAG: F0F1 ATP synthase subunit epsilon [Gammaproteobacteria bacterium]
MAETLKVDVVSAEQSIFTGEAKMVVAPAEMGEVGILPRHTPYLSRLKPGTVRVIFPDGEEEPYYISGGIIEVQPHHVTILADTALRAEDIDEAAALEAKRRAEEALKQKKSAEEIARVQEELIKAAAQLQALEILRRRKGRT